MTFKKKGYKGGIAVIGPNNIIPQEMQCPNEIIFMSGGLEFFLPKFKPLEQKRYVFNISAPSGSGKTYMASLIANAYKKMYPKNNIVFISPINDNETLKKLKPIHINILDKRKVAYNFINPDTKLRVINNPEESMENQKSDFTNCLVIFDDLEGCVDEKIQKLIINELLDPLLSMGRHFCTSIIYCKHLLLDYKKTRNILVEMDFLIVYPNQSKRQIRNVLEKYLGFEKIQVNKIMNCKNRWVCIHAKYPNFVFTDDSIWII